MAKIYTMRQNGFKESKQTGLKKALNRRWTRFYDKERLFEAETGSQGLSFGVIFFAVTVFI